jgi:hypothetical protein
MLKIRDWSRHMLSRIITFLQCDEQSGSKNRNMFQTYEETHL